MICSTTSSDRLSSYSAGVAERNIDFAQVFIFDWRLARWFSARASLLISDSLCSFLKELSEGLRILKSPGFQPPSLKRGEVC
jgi:hypothetical protein